MTRIRAITYNKNTGGFRNRMDIHQVFHKSSRFISKLLQVRSFKPHEEARGEAGILTPDF